MNRRARGCNDASRRRTSAPVVRWHKKSFMTYWWRKSQRGKQGRPSIDPEIKKLVIKIANANPFWGSPRINGELLKLGIEISERTVSGLLDRRPRKPPSQTWRTFINNHMKNMVAVDFLVVPTIRFKVLYVLIILSHARREVVHFNVTTNPTAEWTTRQIVEAFPWDTAPKYLLRDRDSIFGTTFRQRVHSMGIEEVLTAFRSPWQNAYVERLNGSIRRECTDHIIELGESHLRRIFKSYFDYYHEDRTQRDSIHPRAMTRDNSFLKSVTRNGLTSRPLNP